MPPPPKPADRRQRRNTRDRGVVDPAARIRPPPPKRTWLTATRRSWKAFWASEAAALVLPSDLGALSRLWGLYDERDRFLAEATERIVPGSTGQPTVHPAFKAVRAFDTVIIALEDRFGLTPLARLRLGVTFADARRSLADLTDDGEEHPADDPRVVEL